MSYGSDPEDHLYGYDEQEDRWERQYADYLEDQIEAQYVAEMDAEYAASMNLLEESVYPAYFEEPTDNNFVSQMVRGQMARRDEQQIIEEELLQGRNEQQVIEEELIQDSLAHQLLHLPLGENDAQAATVGEYLGLLLSTLWLQADGFSAKRPFGNSDWQYVVYMAMVKAGLATGVVYEEFGYEYLDEIDEIDEVAADEVILQAIRLAYNHER